MSKTFAELGIPFPLYEAQAKEAPEFLGINSCVLCGANGVHCFKVDDLIVVCPQCGMETATRPLPILEESRVCRWCRHEVQCLADSEDSLVVCYACLRSGRAALTKDTVLGMVTGDHAVEGLTHGIPGLISKDYELVPSEDDPEWIRAKVSSELLLELVRTPNYTTWQGECWHFC